MNKLKLAKAKIFQSNKARKKLKRLRKRRKVRNRIIQQYQSYQNWLNQEEIDSSTISKKTYKKFKGYKFINAPENFSFINNTILVLQFIKRLEACITKKQKTFVILHKVLEIDNDAIVVLRSIIARFKNNNILFDGNFPINSSARQVLLDSGFFGSLINEGKFDFYTRKQIKTSIHTHNDLKVNDELALNLIKQTTNTIWGEERRCTKLYRLLIELMGNTHEHADGEQPGQKHWYVCINHLKRERKVTFAFVDYGVGITKSISEKRPGEKGYDFIQYIKNNIPFSQKESNATLLEQILKSERRSSPTKTFRGHGLPSMYKAYENKDIENLNFITNNVKIDVSKDKFTQISENFSGTFVYWELSEHCNSLPKV